MIWQEMILRRRPEMIPGVIPGKETLPGQILTPGNPPVRIQSLRMMTRFLASHMTAQRRELQ